MTSTPDEALSQASPLDSDSEPSSPAKPLGNVKKRPPRSPLASDPHLPYRRSNASLSNLFASTTSLPTHATAPSRSDSGTVTPQDSTAPNGSVFSPAGSTVRSASPALSTSTRLGSAGYETRDIILRAFSPHVSVLASQDTEELIRHKGIHGGLLELLRPFGEHVPGKVTIRDSVGASKSWDDFAVRFVGVKDGIESPRAAPPAANNRNSLDSTTGESRNGARLSTLQEYKPARLRTGGDVPQIEELVERHLTFAEEQSGPFLERDYINHKDQRGASDPNATSPFYLLYLRRLLSGLPLVPSETFSHPIASVIAISSRSQAPIEDLRTLYASSNTGEHRLPHWVHNEFLRYYLLIHDEDYDDLQKSMQLYEQMKRHFGLHCHLLRLRSKPVPTTPTPSSPTSPSASITTTADEKPENIRLPPCDWTAAAEELAEITRRETSEDDSAADLLGPLLPAADAANIRAFVREMVTQSIIPSMERASANWNDQVASRRRGISGRFMSLSKRFTAFSSSSSSSNLSGGGGVAGAGGAGNRNSSGPGAYAGFMGGVGGGGGGGSGNNNYDSQQGFYRPDAPEAVLRRLADYAMMLRDFKLARATYELLCADFKSDKAWRYYAGVNEMAAISSLIVATTPSPSGSAGGGGAGGGGGGGAGGVGAKVARSTTGSLTGGSAASSASSSALDPMLDQYLETAYYSYTTRVNAPYNALRTVLLALELLKLRAGNAAALDEAAKWASRVLEDRLVGPVGHVLLMERVAACFASDRSGGRKREKRRKAAFWNLLACDAWLRLEKASQAERCLELSLRLYTPASSPQPPVTSSLDTGTTAAATSAQAEPSKSPESPPLPFNQMSQFLQTLHTAVKATRSGPRHLDGEDLLLLNTDDEDESQDAVVEMVQAQDESERVGGAAPGLTRRASYGAGAGAGAAAALVPSPVQHRKSLSVGVGGGGVPALAPLQTAFDPLSASPSVQQRQRGRERAGSAATITSSGALLGAHVEEKEGDVSVGIPGVVATPMSGVRRDDGFE